MKSVKEIHLNISLIEYSFIKLYINMFDMNLL